MLYLYDLIFVNRDRSISTLQPFDDCSIVSHVLKQSISLYSQRCQINVTSIHTHTRYRMQQSIVIKYFYCPLYTTPQGTNSYSIVHIMTGLQEPKSKRPAGKLSNYTLLFAACRRIYYCLSVITDTAFKQQRLPAWQPILTARNVMPIFFGIAAAFIPIGIGLLYITNLVSRFCVYIFFFFKKIQFFVVFNSNTFSGTRIHY